MHCLVFVCCACADVMLAYVHGVTMLSEALLLSLFFNTVRSLLLGEACSWRVCVSLLSVMLYVRFKIKCTTGVVHRGAHTICRVCHIRCRDCCFNLRD